MNNKGLCALFLLFAVFPPLAAQQHKQMYVWQQDECHVYDVDNLKSCTFDDDLLFVDMSHVYSISDLDSLCFKPSDNPAVKTVKVGWTGDIDNGQSFYNPLLSFNNGTIHLMMSFQAHGGICTDATVSWCFDDQEEYQLIVQYLYQMLGELGKNFIYTRRTLTRRRHPLTIVGSVEGHQMKLGLFNGQSIDWKYTEFIGKPMSEVQQIMCFWTQKLDDGRNLPSLPPFGKYTDGHYETSLSVAYLLVDFIYNDDRSRVITTEYRLWFGEEEIASEGAEKLQPPTGSVATVTTDGAFVVITEPCDLTPEEALHELTVTVTDMYTPQWMWPLEWLCNE